MGSTSRRDRWPTSRCEALSAGLTLALASCGTTAGHANQAKVEAFGAAGGGASRVEVRESDGHPRLAIVKRDGDAIPAFAVVASVAGPREALSLALVLEARLTDAGSPPRTRVDGTSFALGFYSNDPAGVVKALRSAFAKPIAESDVSRIEAKLASVHAPVAEPFLASTEACAGELALPKGWKHLTTAELEKARSEVFGSAALVFGATGDASFVEAATKAVAASEAFPSGASPKEPDAPSERTALAGRLDEVADGSSEVRITASVADPRAAVSIAKTFEGTAGRALRAKLARLPVPFVVERVAGVAHPKGGCLSLELRGLATGSDDALADAALLAESIAERDVGRALDGPSDPNVALANVLGASDPIDAAELAAWWSEATSATDGAPQPSVAVALSPHASDAVVARVQAGLRGSSKAASTDGIELALRDEAGQGELWLVLANPCAASSESQHQWGSSAASMLARASDESRDDVSLEALIAPDAIGVVAHAPLAKGESPDELARRVAGRAAEAMLGGPPSTDELLRAAGHARRALERDWGKETLGLDVFAGDMSPDHPGAFEPLGSFAGLTKGDVARGVAAWQVVARGPLKLAVLANDGASQGPTALAEASRWVLPGPSVRCPAEASGEPRAGREEVRAEQGSAHGPSRAFIGVPLGKSADGRALGDVLRALFDGPATVADSAVHGIDQAKISARVEGAPPGLVIVVEAPDDRLADVEKAVTELIFRVGRGEVSDDAVNRAISEALLDAERRASDPRQRALALIEGHEPSSSFAPTRVDLARFRAWARTAATEGRLTIVDAHR